jgi:alpha/beta superfamily hydrolase
VTASAASTASIDTARAGRKPIHSTRPTRGPLVLAGSSLGAWIAGRVSLQVPVAGLFLMAPPILLDAAHPLEAAAAPTSIIHGWDDELIPAADVIGWARARGARLLLVDDAHRLSAHVDASAEAFAALLASLPA